MNEKQLPALEKKDYGVNAVQAIVKGIPYVGASLDQFIFGPLQEKRLRRIEATLHEIANSLGETESIKMVSEEFVTLLELVAPELSRSVGENKRERFRDLLFKAAHTCADPTQWAEANLAASILNEIDEPGLCLLAAVGRTKRHHPVTIASVPCPQVAVGEFNYESPGEPQHALPYQWPVIEYWATKLRDQRIILFQSQDARGGFGHVILGPMGEFLIEWLLSE